MKKGRFKSIKGSGRRKSSDRIKGTDTLYSDENFQTSLQYVKENGGRAARHDHKNVLKEYFANHVAKLLLRKYGSSFRFAYVHVITGYLGERDGIANWIRCFFDVVNDPTIARYTPEKFAKATNLSKFPNFRKAATKTFRDAEFTVRKHFTSYKKHYVDINGQRGMITEFDEIMGGVKFTGALLSFYFVSRMPLNIPLELYGKLLVINPKVELFYNLTEHGDYKRNASGKQAGSTLLALGEECAALLFVFQDQKKRRSGR